MSRDTGERDAELLTAYVDGVTELSTDERRRLAARLASDPAARADEVRVRSMLDQLRALPPEGTEPDWGAMERSIQHAVHQAGGRDVPRVWWRSWKWLAPTTTLATAMIVLLVMWARPQAMVQPTGLDRLAPTPRATIGDDFVPLWLDGAEVDVDLSASELLGDAAPGDDDPAMPDGAADADPGLLPSTDLAWVDRLDDAALVRAERWLASASPSAEPGHGPSLGPSLEPGTGPSLGPSLEPRKKG
jgi:hypothetical protein